MSNWIFPSELPGVRIEFTKERLDRTIVRETRHGREFRTTFGGAVPRYRYRVGFEFLRTMEAYRELHALATFLARHAGSFDSFLLREPEDCEVVDHGFGVGDGVTTSFQLQRTLGGDVEDVLGTWPTYDKARTNHAISTWASYTGTTIAAGAAVAPDGSVTGVRIVYDGSGSVGSLRVNSNATPGATLTVGQQYTASIYLRAETPTTVLLGANLGVTVTCNVTTEWQRFTVTANAVSAATRGVVSLLSSAGINTPFTLDAWSPQHEPGPTATRPIGSGAGAMVATPAYWPAYAAGFEPVHQLAPGLEVFIDGDGLGRRKLSRAGRTNLLKYSDQFDNSAWTKGGTATVTLNNAVAPDGSSTADTLNLPAAADGPYQTVAKSATGLYTGSVYLKGTAGQTVRLVVDSGGGTYAGQTKIVTLTGAWQRESVTATLNAGNISVLFHIDRGGGATATSVAAWGAMLEQASEARDYIPTTAAAVSRTDYTLGANGLVAAAVAPRSGAQLSWSGSYFKRARFEGPASVDRILHQVWRAQELGLVSVVP
jgi:hypothetical protein